MIGFSDGTYLPTRPDPTRPDPTAAARLSYGDLGICSVLDINPVLCARFPALPPLPKH